MSDWTPRQMKILDHVRTLRVATVSPRGDPFSAPVRFHFDGTDLYFAASADSEPMKHLRANRRLAILVDLADDGVLQGFVVQGLADKVHSDRESQGVWNAMLAKYPDDPEEEIRVPLVKVASVHVHDLG
ncbi:MAG: pyridoxamine 5'-phosphate oxidase family protein [Thermoplasmata archaeon]|nr:pyridoxamine 5'-phosphate oxidase family protein [Thermoplasmata archaeon]